MVQEKKAMYCKALVELNEIIKHMQPELKNKIPKEIQEEFEENMDKEYTFTYDENISLKEQNIMPETQGLLSVLYSNYLCSEEEKKKWQEYDNFYKQKQYEQKQSEIEKKELFPKSIENKKKEQKTNAEEKVISQELVIVKEKNIFLKIFDKIKSWFSKNKKRYRRWK